MIRRWEKELMALEYKRKRLGIPEGQEIPRFEKFSKIPRLSREVVITEKLDGTNAQIYISHDEKIFLCGSRNRWITPEDDNYGFAKWAHENKDELISTLGPGRHYGEWWGKGIQRGYNLDYKTWSLFNHRRWSEGNPSPLVELTPILYRGPFSTEVIDNILLKLKAQGSKAAPGFMNPEGIIIYHVAGNVLFKKTIHNDDTPKSKVSRR